MRVAKSRISASAATRRHLPQPRIPGGHAGSDDLLSGAKTNRSRTLAHDDRAARGQHPAEVATAPAFTKPAPSRGPIRCRRWLPLSGTDELPEEQSSQCSPCSDDGGSKGEAALPSFQRGSTPAPKADTRFLVRLRRSRRRGDLLGASSPPIALKSVRAVAHGDRGIVCSRAGRRLDDCVRSVVLVGSARRIALSLSRT
jgi:hypothetical protein